MNLIGALFLSISLGAGVSPNYTRVDGGEFLFENETRYYNDFAAELSLEDRLIFVGFSQRNEAEKAQSYYFAPMQSTYTINGGISFGGVEVGFSHFCTHAVESMIQGNIVTDPLFESADTFYVKYSAKFKIN